MENAIARISLLNYDNSQAVTGEGEWTLLARR